MKEDNDLRLRMHVVIWYSNRPYSLNLGSIEFRVMQAEDIIDNIGLDQIKY